MSMSFFMGFNSVLWWTDVKIAAHGYLKLKSNLKFIYLETVWKEFRFESLSIDLWNIIGSWWEIIQIYLLK